VISRSGVLISITNCYIRFTLLLLLMQATSAGFGAEPRSQTPVITLQALKTHLVITSLVHLPDGVSLSTSTAAQINSFRLTTALFEQNCIFKSSDRRERVLLWCRTGQSNVYTKKLEK